MKIARPKYQERKEELDTCRKHGVETKKTCNREERKKSTRKSRKTEKGQTEPKKQTKKGLVCLSISLCVS